MYRQIMIEALEIQARTYCLLNRMNFEAFDSTPLPSPPSPPPHPRAYLKRKCDNSGGSIQKIGRFMGDNDDDAFIATIDHANGNSVVAVPANGSETSNPMILSWKDLFCEDQIDLDRNFDEFLEAFAMEECPQGTGGHYLKILETKFESLMHILGIKPTTIEDGKETAVMIFNVGCMNWFDARFEIPSIPTTLSFTRRLQYLTDLTHACRIVFNSLFSPYARALPCTVKVREVKFKRIHGLLYGEYLKSLEFVKKHVLTMPYRSWDDLPNIAPNLV